jgi:hypothetical protein
MSSKLLVSPLAIILAATIILGMTFLVRNDYAAVPNQIIMPSIDLDAPLSAFD